MSDLTFASPRATSSELRSSSESPKSKRSFWINVFVVVLVVALLAEAGYFFYNRYISNEKVLDLKNLSTDETMDYQTSPVPAAEVIESVGAIVSHTGDMSRQKADSVLDHMGAYPQGYVYKSSINMSIQGKVVAVLSETIEDDNVTYIARLRLVNTKGDSKSMLFSEDEIERMRVVTVDKGVIQKEVKYSDIKPGDFLNIHVSSDLFDLRNGADDITIEIRTN